MHVDAENNRNGNTNPLPLLDTLQRFKLEFLHHLMSHYQLQYDVQIKQVRTTRENYEHITDFRKGSVVLYLNNIAYACINSHYGYLV